MGYREGVANLKVEEGRVELVNDSGKVINVWSQVVTNSANIGLSDGVENVRLAGPPVEVFFGHKFDQCTSSIRLS